MKAALLLAIILSVAGCDDITSANSKKAEKPRSTKKSAPIHRFVQESYNAGVAFDTQTGQICKTWDWKPMGPDAKPDANGNTPQRTLGEFSPMCSSLYALYPSQVEESEQSYDSESNTRKP